MAAAPAVSDALRLAEQGATVLLATASPEGEPHLTAVSSLEEVEAPVLQATGWFCPRAVANVDRNPRVALLVLDAGADGFQLTGEVVSAEQLAMLDGYDPGLEGAEPLPQVQWSFRVVVEEVLAHADRAHADTPVEARK